MFATAAEAALIADHMPSMSRVRVTYFLRGGAGGPIKIGSTQDLATRMRVLNLMSPVPLVLVGLVQQDIEKHCHQTLAPFRIHGEWSSLTPA